MSVQNYLYLMINGKPDRWVRFGTQGLVGLFCLQLSACSWRAPQASKSTAKPVQGGVSFSDVVLAQADVKGKLLWKFQAKGVTSGEGQQVAAAQSIKGQLYEAGKPLFDIAAEQATVKQATQQVSLQGKIQVTDRLHRVVFRGREAHWNPQTGQLMVRSGLMVTHPQLRLWANELKASKKGSLIQVKGSVVMETLAGADPQKNQRIRLKANQALWNVAQQKFQAGVALGNEQQPTVQIEQLNPVGEKSVALAGDATADLKRGVVALSSPVRLTMGDVTLTSRELTWETVAGRIFTRELLQLQDPRRQVTVLANGGSVEQAQNLVNFQGKVEVTGLKDRARLTSDKLLWNTKTERIEALGNVNYVQENPAFTLRGPRAVGTIKEQTLRISGGDVVTEIMP
jgi:lipopolysaccharide assembly outer membrane protein LptD (OstA)